MQSWESVFDYPRLSAAGRERAAATPPLTQRRHARSLGRQTPLELRRIEVEEDQREIEATLPLKVVQALKGRSEVYWSLKKAIRDKALHALLHRRSTETPPVGNTAGSSSTGGDGTGSIRHGGRKKLSMRRNLTLLKHKLRGTTFSPTNAVGAGNQTQSGQSCDRTDIMRDTVVEGTLKNASEIMAIQHHNTVQRHLRPSRELSCVCKLRKEFDIAIFDAVESFMVQHKVRPVVMTARSTPLSAVSVAKPSSSQVRTETMDEYWDRLKCRLPDFAAARARARVGPKGCLLYTSDAADE